MKNFGLELKAKFKEYLQLSKSHLKLDSGIESIIEDGKLKNGEISKLKKSTEIYYENEKKLKAKDESNKVNKEKLNIKKIRKVSLKIENKDIKNFSSETKIKYSLEKIENIYLKKKN